jgi:hypothetical protein
MVSIALIVSQITLASEDLYFCSESFPAPTTNITNSSANIANITSDASQVSSQVLFLGTICSGLSGPLSSSCSVLLSAFASILRLKQLGIEINKAVLESRATVPEKKDSDVVEGSATSASDKAADAAAATAPAATTAAAATAAPAAEKSGGMGSKNAGNPTRADASLNEISHVGVSSGSTEAGAAETMTSPLLKQAESARPWFRRMFAWKPLDKKDDPSPR